MVITFIVGGQYGSEGKGSFAHWYGQKIGVAVWGRAGGSQAGHSVMIGGTVVKLRQLPVGALVPQSISVIGPGAIVDPQLLEKEISICEIVAGETPIVIVDPLATVMPEHAANMEQATGLTERIGSTGEGVGAARAERIWRRSEVMSSVDHGRWTLQPIGDYLKEAIADKKEILIEGTQGAALSLFAPWYPFTTSHSCHPAQLAADMEISIRTTIQVLALYRTFPIRVGGNSGPLPEETDWETLQASFGEHIPVEETTVTGRTRRVGNWDPILAEWSTRYLDPTGCVLTFLDYPFPEIAGQTEGELPPEAKDYIRERERDLRRIIRYVGTGFGTYLSRWEGCW